MTILTFLQRNQEARKVFGKRELKIIEKQLIGVNLTQSEKNRLSRDIRKKFEFIKKAARFEEEFSLKKGAQTKRKIEEMKETILEHPLRKKIQNIKVFGSVVDNTVSVRSDIDIAVTFDSISTNQATRFRQRVLGNCPDKADVQVYNTLPTKIQKDIDKKGRVIYERKN